MRQPDTSLHILPYDCVNETPNLRSLKLNLHMKLRFSRASKVSVLSEPVERRFPIYASLLLYFYLYQGSERKETLR